MTVYRYNRRYKKRWQKTKKFLVISLATIGVLVVGYVLIIRTKDAETIQGKSVEISNNPYVEFSTGYYTFSASKSWQLAEDLGNGVDTFIYRKYKGSEPTGLLTIRIDKQSEVLSTRIVPVTVSDGRISEVGLVSDHCSKFLPAGLNLDPHDAIVEDVSFRCWTDGTSFIASAGARGGGLALPLKRVDGSLTNYFITYQNTSTEPDTNAILDILKTFEAH